MRPLNLILLDDEKLVRKSLIKIIDWSLPITLAKDFSNGREAVAWLEENPVHVDIVLTDSLMPEMDGVEFARWVGERYPDAMVIFFSGHSEYDLMRNAMRTKAFDYILKPVDRKVLNATLRNAVELLTGRDSLQSISDTVLQNILLGKLTVSDGLFPRTIEVSRVLWVNSVSESVLNHVSSVLDTLCKFHGVRMPEETKGHAFLCLGDGSELDDAFVAALDDALRSFDNVFLGISAPVSDENLHDAFLQAWQTALSLFSSRRLRSAVYADTEQNRLVCGIVAYINDHFLEQIGLQDIVDKFGYTYTYVSKLVTQALGTSFTDYITSLRLAKAKELLAVPSLKISLVSMNSGFSSTTYFNKVFKQTEGMTPLEYRQRICK
jgi:two-component system response regulator YesN